MSRGISLAAMDDVDRSVVFETRRALRSAWRDLIASLGVADGGRILIAGRNVDVLVDELPAPTANVGPGLAVLGPEPMALDPEPMALDPAASSSATGLADAAVDTVALIKQWS